MRTNMLSKPIDDFKRLSPPRQAAIVAITAWNVYLSVVAEWGIQRRPAAQVRGRKAFWRVACLTNTVGPVSYFRWGRR
jgi:hypothetical protein